MLRCGEKHEDLLMGDMADAAHEMVEAEEQARADFRTGRIDPYEAYELGIIDELGYEYNTSIEQKTCRNCKAHGLHWRKLQGKWRLFDGDKMHECPVAPLPHSSG